MQPNVHTLPHGDIAALAAQVGINWSLAQDSVRWDGQWKNSVPALEKKYEGRCSLISRVQDGVPIITFHTLKEGGRTETWRGDREQSSRTPSFEAKRERLTQERIQEAAASRKARINAAYIDCYAGKSTQNIRLVAPRPFAYLDRKGIGRDACELQFMEDKNGVFLAIPLSAGGRITGLERIYEDGAKKATPGAKKAGASYVIGAGNIGELANHRDNVYVVEGWATGKAVHAVTGCPVVVAFSANNLKPVFRELLATIPASRITIAADKDQAGLLQALELNYMQSIKVRFPNFDGLDTSGEKLSDFNDLLLLAGEDETLGQLTSAKKSVLRSPRNATDYWEKRLELTTVRSASDKALANFIRHALKGGLIGKALEDAILRVKPKLDEELMTTAIATVSAQVERAVAKLHTINEKRRDITPITLDLERQDHGGYLIDEHFYESIKDLHGIILVRTPMGSGKTERVIKPALEQARKGAYIAHRVALVLEASKRLGIVPYQHYNAFSAPKVATCINSLTHSKFDYGEFFEGLDLVCIDEATKVFAQLKSDLIERPDEVTSSLIASLKSAKQVIICDADANDTLIDILATHVGHPIFVAQASPKLDHINVSVTSIIGAFYQLFKLARQGKKICCACDSKKDVKKIERKLRDAGLRVLAIHSQTKDDPTAAAWLQDPSKESEKYDVVVFNSAVDSGVSIVTDHFDCQFGLFRGVITPQSAIQMLGRNRKSREWIIGCSPIISTRYGNTPAASEKALLALSNSEGAELSSFDRIKVLLDYEDVCSRKDYALTLNVMLEQKGYNVSLAKPKEAHLKQVKKEMALLGEELEGEFIAKILAANTPLKTDYLRMKHSHVVTDKEFHEVVRYEIMKGLGCKKIDQNDVIAWMNGMRQKVETFELLTTDMEKLKEYDAWEIERGVPKSLRKFLAQKARFLQMLLSYLNIDLKSGSGSFTHKDASKFIQYLLTQDGELETWNQLKLGAQLQKKGPKDPTKWVKEALKNLGLKTVAGLYGKDRAAYHEICPSSWALVTGYIEKRKASEQNIAAFTKREKALGEWSEPLITTSDVCTWCWDSEPHCCATTPDG